MTISVDEAELILFGVTHISGDYSDDLDEISYHDVWDLIFGWGSKDHVFGDFIVRGVETQGGNEGDGDHTHMVFLIEDATGSGQYFRIDGFYSSYGYGTSWDGHLYEVSPVQRLVTFYESV